MVKQTLKLVFLIFFVAGCSNIHNNGERSIVNSESLEAGDSNSGRSIVKSEIREYGDPNSALKLGVR